MRVHAVRLVVVPGARQAPSGVEARRHAHLVDADANLRVVVARHHVPAATVVRREVARGGPAEVVARSRRQVDVPGQVGAHDGAAPEGEEARVRQVVGGRVVLLGVVRDGGRGEGLEDEAGVVGRLAAQLGEDLHLRGIRVLAVVQLPEHLCVGAVRLHGLPVGLEAVAKCAHEEPVLGAACSVEVGGVGKQDGACHRVNVERGGSEVAAAALASHEEAVRPELRLHRQGVANRGPDLAEVLGRHHVVGLDQARKPRPDSGVSGGCGDRGNGADGGIAEAEECPGGARGEARRDSHAEGVLQSTLCRVVELARQRRLRGTDQNAPLGRVGDELAQAGAALHAGHAEREGALRQDGLLALVEEGADEAGVDPHGQLGGVEHHEGVRRLELHHGLSSRVAVRERRGDPHQLCRVLAHENAVWELVSEEVHLDEGH
mmetsp:Transcript_16568/g.62696  ORF Transcript_16568/g.62696 Transcript_16568/m.62696 type:complete len:433 (-) Transcript_16568:46-1344(-)